MNISIRGRAFLSNNGEGVFERPKRLAGEAMVQVVASPEHLALDSVIHCREI
jgi:hypothetical protein